MTICFGKDIAADFPQACAREWLVSNGIGGYAAGTLAGPLTRCYHGLLVAALQPPLDRMLLVSKLEEEVFYDQAAYPLFTNQWAEGEINPQGYRYLESFQLEGTIPCWTYRLADVRLEKRIWMQPGENTTYVQYHLLQGSAPVTLSIRLLVNYRSMHSRTQGGSWQMQVEPVERGIRIVAFPEAVPFYLLCQRPAFQPRHTWIYRFRLQVEAERGLEAFDDHLEAAYFSTPLQVGETVTLVLSTQPQPNLDGTQALNNRRTYEQQLLQQWQAAADQVTTQAPDWIQHLVLAADQFIVQRSLPEEPEGKSILAGYHWFADWGRDAMISLPGLTLTTGRADIARQVLRTFARYLDQGMLPNRFPDAGEAPEYNTVDATLWYFEALRSYATITGDHEFIHELFPALAEIIDWHRRGTRYQIHRDAEDGLLFAGEAGVQLTWMDAKVGDWVVTPRIGKPVEVNVFWIHALGLMTQWAEQLGQDPQDYRQMHEQAVASFARFWCAEGGYCFDVLDGPEGHDASLRPNQIFAVSFPASRSMPPLLTPAQEKAVVDCSRKLLTCVGLRSLSPDHPSYQGIYIGDQVHRDGAYHQGTVWGWLLGAYALAYWRVYGNAAAAQTWLQPMAHHLSDHGVGSLSEIFDGDPPSRPRGCIAQAWTVAEILRAWTILEEARLLSLGS